MNKTEQKPKVLVVDDENIVRESINRVLSESGYNINTAANGAIAINKVSKESFDIAFVDLKMPDIDGMEVVRYIRKTRPTVQVVIITGYGTKENANEAKTLGVSDFISKPLTPDMINSLAQKAWENKLSSLKEVYPSVIPLQGSPVGADHPLVHMEIPAETTENPPSFAQAVTLLVKGPLMGLAYVMFLPLIGFAILFQVAGKKIYGKLATGKGEK